MAKGLTSRGFVFSGHGAFGSGVLKIITQSSDRAGNRTRAVLHFMQKSPSSLGLYRSTCLLCHLDVPRATSRNTPHLSPCQKEEEAMSPMNREQDKLQEKVVIALSVLTPVDKRRWRSGGVVAVLPLCKHPLQLLWRGITSW